MSDCRARGRKFNLGVEIDHEIISAAILLPFADLRRVVNYKLKHGNEVLVNRLVKLAEETNVVR